MERHNLINEFPEFREKIHELKVSNTHFRNLFDEYHELEHRIHNINMGDEVVIDEFAHELKTKFMFLKDQIFEYLKNQ